MKNFTNQNTSQQFNYINSNFCTVDNPIACIITFTYSQSINIILHYIWCTINENHKITDPTTRILHIVLLMVLSDWKGEQEKWKGSRWVADDIDVQKNKNKIINLTYNRRQNKKQSRWILSVLYILEFYIWSLEISDQPRQHNYCLNTHE